MFQLNNLKLANIFQVKKSLPHKYHCSKNQSTRLPEKIFEFTAETNV